MNSLVRITGARNKARPQSPAASSGIATKTCRKYGCTRRMGVEASGSAGFASCGLPRQEERVRGTYRSARVPKRDGEGARARDSRASRYTAPRSVSQYPPFCPFCQVAPGSPLRPHSRRKLARANGDKIHPSYVVVVVVVSRGRNRRERERGSERALTRRSIHNVACLPSTPKLADLNGVTCLVVSRFLSHKIMTKHRVVSASGTRIGRE